MAINNPHAVRFCNERARVLAESMVVSYETAKAFVAYWDANGIGSFIPDNVNEVVMDNADVDGRPQANGAKINALYVLSNALVNFFDTGTPSRITRLRQLAVNGQSRF